VSKVALFSPPERILDRRDSLDDTSRASFMRRAITAGVLGGIALTTFASSIEQISQVWQGRDQYETKLGRSKE
jgi:hypothetical protein